MTSTRQSSPSSPSAPRPVRFLALFHAAAIAIVTTGLLSVALVPSAHAQATEGAKPGNEVAVTGATNGNEAERGRKPADVPSSIQTPADESPGLEQAEAIARLAELGQQIEAREKALETLRRTMRGRSKAELSDEEISALEIVNRELGQMRSSFEQLALGGLDTSILNPAEEKPYDWQAELLDVIKPVLGSLKELTEKPRRIEGLRRQLETARNQKQIVERALNTLQERLAATKMPQVREDLTRLYAQWEQRRVDIDSRLDVARYQLAALDESATEAWTSFSAAAYEFMEGRGLTLGIALLAAFVVWLVVRLVFAILRRLRRGQKRTAKRRRERTLHYLNRLITLLLMTVAVLVTFYVRSDVLLLALSILALGLLFIGIRQALPRYFAEIRLLTDFGAVREEERLIHDGIPMQVRDMGAFAILTNPELKGFVRLELSELAKMNSRPTAGEPWFPTHGGDYVKMTDGRFAQVMNQTIDTVTLRVGGSIADIAANVFYASSPMNLSREGFVVALTFGIGYQHRAICLDEVPDKMKQAVAAAVAEQEYGGHCSNILVEFAGAAANSLDYLVVLSFSGEAAGSYLAVPRMIQRTLVRLCNQESWDIPFAQIVVHPPPAN